MLEFAASDRGPSHDVVGGGDGTRVAVADDASDEADVGGADSAGVIEL